MHNKTSKTNKIVIAIIAFLSMLLLVYPKSLATDDETAKAVKEYDENIYTIEAIVYNKVPLFDVNVFSDTAAGKKVNEKSIMGRVRKATAGWYVTLMGITYVILAVLIIYYGIRLAISTIPEEKANYKQQLYNWFKALITAATIHYVIYIVLTLNDYFVNQIANVAYNSEEGSTYNTIKTRAMNEPFGIGWGATILYLTLLFMWFRFLWTYLKRDITVLLYIILAPLVVIRYAYEMAGGKKSKALSNWFQRFATSVFIQSIHALFYSVFVATAMQVATNNMHSFILAIMILSFMLDADTIFTNIFKFQFQGKDIDALDRPFMPKTDLATIYTTYNIAKSTLPNVSNQAKSTALGIRYGIKSIGNNTTIYPNENSRLNKLRNKLDVKKIQKLSGKNTERAKKQIQMAEIRIMSRRKGTQGIQAREVLRLKEEERNRKFLSSAKFVKTIAETGIEYILAIPIGVSYGVDLGATTFSNAISNSLNIPDQINKKKRESYKKYNKSLDDIVNSVQTVYNETGIVEQKFAELAPEEKDEVKNEIKKYQSLDMNKFKIKKEVETKITDTTGVRNNDELNEILDNINNKLPTNISNEEKEQIKADAIHFIEEARAERTGEPNIENQNENNTQNRNDRTRTFTREDVINGIDKAVIKFAFAEEHGEIGEAIDTLSSVNSKELSKKDSNDKNFGEMINLNKFVDSLS